MKEVEIIDMLKMHYGLDALHQTQIDSGIKEMKSGRKDFSNIAPPGRVPGGGLDDCIAKGFKEDPLISTKKIAKDLKSSSTTVRNHLASSFAGSATHPLEKHAASSFHFPPIDDESSMFYEYHHNIVWAASWGKMDELERRSHYHRRTMATACFNNTASTS